MMVCLIFHTAIIINRKNGGITIKLYFQNLITFFLNWTYTHARTLLPLFLFVSFSMTSPSLPQSTYFLNDPLVELVLNETHSHDPCIKNLLHPHVFQAFLISLKKFIMIINRSWETNFWNIGNWCQKPCGRELALLPLRTIEQKLWTNEIRSRNDETKMIKNKLKLCSPLDIRV